ncbi:response regulator [Jannaschia aquimarina]|uniref:PhoP protein n=1 Tax=Jannaschia aquimarina TaxID=935700 RepID=A0A0D1EJ71_9RHOB|nr:response regulator [Jannaschia aquimarina]KIT15825.1 Virulence transcriptional regulatory protein PhoP [Jannaschia aquimarina]SNT09476.1 CheY chemotaxis protein or a CheY-like REC (receiver) domain [Jannaschia aquimarina]
MDDLTLHTRPLTPTAQRPLLGLTVLAVEDSRFASEALRLLCLRSGARIRRADCIASAERHLRTYLADVAIVDLGLPDGSGLTLIERLTTAQYRPKVILATSGVDRSEAETAAKVAGADGFLAKPIESIAVFQQAILAHLPSEHHPKGVRRLSRETVVPDRLALVEDLAYAERMLEDEEVSPGFVAGFLQGLARTGGDPALLSQTRGLRDIHEDIRPRLRELIAERRSTKRII